MKTLISVLVIVMVLLVAIAVGAQNEQLVSVNYIIAATQMHLSTVIALCIFIGIVICLILCLGYILRLKWKVTRLHKQLARLNKQNQA
ncbi:LapA family protein [Neptunicella sp. SCSIO 80796]|uniref:LapA family protein n=1 Tax=Neptunicella plasticusilytica TaxID=3117012 RepID=UPI003A4E253B